MHRIIPFIAALALLVPAGIALADDFQPPPWDRYNPYAVMAEWDFNTNADPVTPDTFIPGSPMSGKVTTQIDIGTGMVFTGGGWMAPTLNQMVITMDNVVDFEPIKYVRVQVTHNQGASIGIDAIEGEDNLPGTLSVTPVVATPVSAVYTLFTFEIRPNPDWEQFNLWMGSGTTVDQVVVDTLSIPEPASMALLAVGAALWRRRS